ncbi:MAG: UDP-2,3-diacylglucosamine diphosphatase [Melioribacteraceae bacterium]|nr:UDP-2,3-diacylglucosamine diphosphatase [Melioribacteraceae bacterium]
MKKPVYFISDTHFGLQSRDQEKKKEDLLVEFLIHTKETASQLYILGDLFDYWFEYRRVIQKGYFRTFTGIYNLTEANIPVKYIIGNHDFMHRDFFENELGVEILPDEYSTEIEGKKFFLAHGDGMVKNDDGYKLLKKILRNKKLQNIYSLIHPDLGIWLASSSSKTSRNYTEQKNYGEIDGLSESALEILEKGFDYVIFGHSHQRQELKHRNGKYINLGTWLDEPCYGKFNGLEFEIINWLGNEQN